MDVHRFLVSVRIRVICVIRVLSKNVVSKYTQHLKYLFILKAVQLDCRATTGGCARAAAFTHCGINRGDLAFFIKRNGIIGTHGHTRAAAAATYFVHIAYLALSGDDILAQNRCGSS